MRGSPASLSRRWNGDGRYFIERRGNGVRIIGREMREQTGREPKFGLIDGSELPFQCRQLAHRQL